MASPDGKMIYKTQMSGNDPEKLGELVANKLTENGAKNLIDQVKKDLEGK